MITRTQAQAVGDNLIELAHQEELAQRNASARSVPFVYRFEELKRLERWERPVLVEEAKRYAMRQPKVLALWALLGGAVIYFAFISVQQRLSIPLLAAWVGAAALMAPVYFYRRSVMRSYIRNRVAALQKVADDRALQ
ncbi:hypothetical protein [Niveibacterium sp.]|uniref:hypothetical protein n=1 Tax=Niveibacterium sp. TaxID=2017444 RepID=UPI0035B2E430